MPVRKGTPDRLSIEGMAVTRRVGLQLAPALPYASWAGLGMQLSLIADSSAWWLGDWLVYGEIHFADRYQRAMTNSSLCYQTLRNYAWVARRFPMSRRRDSLSFQHHVEVARLPEKEQDEWLDRAQAGSWSRNRLRREIRAGRAAGQAPSGPAPAVLRVSIAPDRWSRWDEAATFANQSLAEWAARVLDDAAGSTLDSGLAADALSASALDTSALDTRALDTSALDATA
jgi:hypothetical protein